MNHSHEVGQIVVDWVLETWSLDDGDGDGGGNGGGDIVLIGSSTAAPCEAFRARGDEQLVVNRPEDLRCEREG